ncbi:MAG TPA: F0F1 ATP synthase subunit A [Verrucomicrobiae bacterium]
MPLFRTILMVAMMIFSPLCLDAAQESTIQNAPADAKALTPAQVRAGGEHGTGEKAESGLPLYASPVFHIGPLPVTNSMIVTWAVALLLIVGAQMATRNIKDVPEGAQNFWEWLVEGLYNFLEGIVGYELAKKTFWFFATIFILILACNWFGLVPGVGTVGWGHSDGSTFLGVANLKHVAHPWLRGANADLNMTLAMSMIFFVLWTVWALQANGPGGFILHLFGPKGEVSGIVMKILMIVIFIIVGFLEVVSILFRPVSLSFRLYGNIFAGENMLEAMSTLVPPPFGWLVPIPFYGMELMVGLVQALVFMLLTAVFTLLICTHEEGHSKHEH